MNFREDLEYRLSLARGFLEEALEDLKANRYRSCVDNSQLSLENSAKAILAFYGPVSKTHSPSEELLALKNRKGITVELAKKIGELAAMAAEYGAREHFLSDYGDEVEKITPWEIFNREDAQKASATAEKGYKLALEIKSIILV